MEEKERQGRIADERRILKAPRGTEYLRELEEPKIPQVEFDSLGHKQVSCFL